jgi:type III restriction enzyme
VKTKKAVYIIETKSDKDLMDPNVKQKQVATLDWVKRINQLNPEDRMERKWVYILLGENHFYGLSGNGASIDEICDLAKVNLANAEGKLFI